MMFGSVYLIFFRYFGGFIIIDLLLLLITHADKKKMKVLSKSNIFRSGGAQRTQIGMESSSAP